jgi:hypothetical protein
MTTLPIGIPARTASRSDFHLACPGFGQCSPVRMPGRWAITGTSGQLPLGGMTPRTVLGYLSLHPSRVIRADELIAAVWKEKHPASARKTTVQTRFPGSDACWGSTAWTRGRPDGIVTCQAK